MTPKQIEMLRQLKSEQLKMLDNLFPQQMKPQNVLNQQKILTKMQNL